MIIEAIYGETNQLLEKSMELRWVKQGMLAANIANAETPGYRAVDIDFRATMAELVRKMQETGSDGQPAIELRRTDPRHLGHGGADAPESEPGKVVFGAGDAYSFSNDSNTVEIEEQLARLQHNATMYSATARILNRRLSGFSTLIDNLGRI